MKIRLIYFTLLFLLTGCGPQIDAWVNSGAKHPILAPVIEPPIFTTASSKPIKYSPGASLASGPQADAKYTLTPTNAQLTGPQANAKVSINQNRVE